MDQVWKADIVVDKDPALQEAIHANEYQLYASMLLRVRRVSAHRGYRAMAMRAWILGRGYLDVSRSARPAS